MSLTDDGARPHHLASLAPRVARGTDLIQPAKGRRQVFSLGQGTLSSRLACAIEIKDHPGVSRSIHQASGLLLVGVGREGAALEIVEKEGTEGFDRFRCQRRQKARER